MSSDIVPPILMYHSVTPHRHDPSPWAVSLDRFDQQMRWLRRRGWRGVSMRELLRMGDRDGSGRRLVGLTFDDGYADFAECALPVLQRYRFNATAFVIAGRMGGDSCWADGPLKTLLNAAQVRQVAATGVEIGSHGLWHVSLPSVDHADLAEETATSRRILQEASGQDVAGFCYPYGHLDARVVGSAQAAGYEYVCASGYTDFTGRHALPRIYVGDKDSPARLWAKAMRYWVRWEYRGPGSRALASASALRSRLHRERAASYQSASNRSIE